jgi:tRNA nucleotidyltransferase (CCA-adding enzyme)
VQAGSTGALSSFDLAIAISRRVHDVGGRSLIVGGWVRDRLMGRTCKDLDLEVYGLAADRLKSLLAEFGSVNTVGESFTVYKVADVDVALPRRESRTGRGHRAFEVTGDPNLSFDDAARRRDFTINAIAWDPLTEEYIDPFKGRGDIAAKILRAVDPRTFAEDSLRVLRAVQFGARFEFVLDGATRELCRGIALDDLPSERIWGEIEKLLRQAARPSIGFQLALDLGVIERVFPEIHALVGCQQEPEWHPEGDVWIHTLLVIDQARTRIDDLDRARQIVVMLGAVCHDLGKPLTTACIDGRIRSIDHEQAGVAPSVAVLDRLNIHSIDGYDVRKQVLGIVAHHLKPGMFRQSPTPVSDGAFRRLAEKVDLEMLARVAKSDCLGRTGYFDCSAMDWFLERATSLGVEHAPPAPIVKGRHLLALGLKPGPRVGAVLRQIYEKQLDGSITNLEDGIALAREILAEQS